ncbi:pteridine-dependent deoxygenase like protein [Sulfuriferula plumbiphila]|uniref:Pteridine-dependent deoxygenase like protein n=1 Tax=Sulfuriferula plumbiphila TaxID=171865 RepID=A0A512L967_9PROT|nr:Rid family hydrolase [Sulfuriferula plumbiphila]BBP04370.1 pteridine-dependent deoxygenase like protein [Sulfuriferula plumbiphila]GEP31013.1 pteridine-dependent deoxygenase like protein [Sulfuriferula plumbiphila]
MRDTVSPLHGANLSIAAFLKQPAQWKNSVLGALCFSADAVESRMQADMEVPCMHVPMQRLDAGASICEVWRGSAQLTQGRCGAIHYRHDDDVLFGVIVLPETMFAAGAGKTPLQQATESAYRQVFALLDTLRYPYLFRFWNYIADINTHSFGLERYRQFNLGRQDAFLAHGREVMGNVPAACALGSAQGPLTIAFLAGRVAPLSIENPRQISAYQYPQQYGPRSPTFSRASLVRLGQAEVLFVSGTASIVGHATLHPADVVAQTRETMANIEAVLAQANRRASQSRFALASLYYKVYVRHCADLAQIRTELERIVGSVPNAIYLQADVCRQDLLLEIEATAGHTFVFMSGNRD